MSGVGSCAEREFRVYSSLTRQTDQDSPMSRSWRATSVVVLSHSVWQLVTSRCPTVGNTHGVCYCLRQAGNCRRSAPVTACKRTNGGDCLPGLPPLGPKRMPGFLSALRANTLLLIGVHGHTLQQHAAPPQSHPVNTASSSERRHTISLDAGEPAGWGSPAASLPFAIFSSAARGELQAVTKWLRKGGSVDAFGSVSTSDGKAAAFALLHAATANGHLKVS